MHIRFVFQWLKRTLAALHDYDLHIKLTNDEYITRSLWPQTKAMTKQKKTRIKAEHKIQNTKVHIHTHSHRNWSYNKTVEKILSEERKKNNNAHDRMREKYAKLAVVFDLRPKRRVLFGATDKQSIQGGDFHLGCLNTRTFYIPHDIH